MTLLFPDGTAIAGEDAPDVLTRLGVLQWSPMPKDEMKARLSDRAWLWSRFTLDPNLPDDEFLTALDASTLCAVIWGPNPAKPKGWSLTWPPLG